MKRRLFILHSWLGLIAALGLIIVGLSGSILVFHDEIDRAMSPAQVVVTPTPAGRLPYDTLLSGVRKAHPGHVVTGWSLGDAPDKADQLYLVPAGTSDWTFVRLNPYTGELLTTPASSSQTFTGWLLELHYSFFADHAGLLIVGLFAVLLCLLGVTGVWLYRGFWKTFFTLRWDRSARIFFSDTHKMIGITTVAFNLILGFTGAWWNLTHLFHHLVEDGGFAEEPKITQTYESTALSLDELAGKARTTLPEYQPGYISLPTSEKDFIMIYGGLESDGPFRSGYGCTATFDRTSGEMTDLTNVAEAGLWTQVLDSFTPLHYGTFGGLFVKILWSLGGLAPGILSITGVLMWYSRKFPKRRKATEESRVSTRDEKGELEAVN